MPEPLTPRELRRIIRSHRLWTFMHPDGEQAILIEANLYEADLTHVDLRQADLRGADLEGADLSEADLSEANLDGCTLLGAVVGATRLRNATLRDADLSNAYLLDADLTGADLAGAHMSKSTFLPTGETWEEYCTEVVPALLTAGGKSLEEVVSYWHGLTWPNCPLAVAFGVSALEDVPALYRPRAEQFAQLYDAGLLRKPKVPTPQAGESRHPPKVA
jgi:hypothetical protein